MLDPVDTYLESRFKSRVIVPFSRKRPIGQTVTTATTTTTATTLATVEKPEKPVFEAVNRDQTEAMNTPQTERHSKTLEELDEQASSDHPLMNLPPDETSWIPPNKRRKTDRLRKKTTDGESVKEEAPSKKITCGELQSIKELKLYKITGGIVLQSTRGRKCSVHDPEVVGSNPSQVEPHGCLSVCLLVLAD